MTSKEILQKFEGQFTDIPITTEQFNALSEMIDNELRKQWKDGMDTGASQGYTE